MFKGHRKRNKRDRKDRKLKKDLEKSENNKGEEKPQAPESNLKYVDAPLPKTNPWKIKNSGPLPNSPQISVSFQI